MNNPTTYFRIGKERIRYCPGTLRSLRKLFDITSKIALKPQVRPTDGVGFGYGFGSIPDRIPRVRDIPYFFGPCRHFQLIRRIEAESDSRKVFKVLRLRLYHHRRRYRDRIMCFLGKVESADTCVQVADFFHAGSWRIYYVAIIAEFVSS